MVGISLEFGQYSEFYCLGCHHVPLCEGIARSMLIIEVVNGRRDNVVAALQATN